MTDEWLYTDQAIDALFLKGVLAECYALASDEDTKGAIRRRAVAYAASLSTREKRKRCAEKMRSGGFGQRLVPLYRKGELT